MVAQGRRAGLLADQADALSPCPVPHCQAQRILGIDDEHSPGAPRDDRLDARQVGTTGDAIGANVVVVDVEHCGNFDVFDRHPVIQQAAAGDLEDAGLDLPVEQELAGVPAAAAIASLPPFGADTYAVCRTAAYH